MTTPIDYREYAYSLASFPLRGEMGERYTGMLGVIADVIMQGLTDAIEAGSLSSDKNNLEIAEIIGQNRMLPRFPGESYTSYRDRLLDAWNTWSYAGTTHGIISQLARMGLTASVVADSEWANPGDEWDAIGAVSYNARFWVIIDTHPWLDIGTWGDGGYWDSGETWGTSATIDEVNAVRRIINDFRPVHMICHTIIIDMGGFASSPDGTWDYWANRDTNARYWSP